MSSKLLNRLPIIATSMAVGAALTTFSDAPRTVVSAAHAAEMTIVTPPAPWSIEGLKTMTLDALPDIDWAPVESGTARNAETVVFEGQNIVSIWDAGPAKLILDEPLPYDEFVVVLKGTLVLTNQKGEMQTYTEGDMFMLPKGFKGVWEMTEEYRELIVVDTDTYNES
ncbi:MAG: cupin domain-containing protein [Pseudomonadota bacterium]